MVNDRRSDNAIVVKDQRDGCVFCWTVPEEVHPSGLPLGHGECPCSSCAWCMSDAEGRACVMAVVTDERGPPLPDDCPGCALWEPRIDSCDLCGACCREAFDSVALQPDDRVLQEHPDLIRHHSDGWRDLERVPSETGWGSRCIALLGRGKTDSPYRCTIYGARPTNCRDLKAGAVACRTARQRVGLSSLPPGVARDGPWASMML